MIFYRKDAPVRAGGKALNIANKLERLPEAITSIFAQLTKKIAKPSRKFANANFSKKNLAAWRLRGEISWYFALDSHGDTEML